MADLYRPQSDALQDDVPPLKKVKVECAPSINMDTNVADCSYSEVADNGCSKTSNSNQPYSAAMDASDPLAKENRKTLPVVEPSSLSPKCNYAGPKSRNKEHSHFSEDDLLEA